MPPRPLTSPAAVQRAINARHRAQRIASPMPTGLLSLRHRLAADLAARNLARINQVHAASLRRSAPPERQAGPDKQKTSDLAGSEVFTDATTVLGVERGRFTECA